MAETESYSYSSNVQTLKKTKESKNIFSYILNLYKKSMKPAELDEPLVFFFYRPLSFIIAFFCYPLPVSPNAITILRGLTGIAAGILFALGSTDALFYGGIILFLSILFDCADGQLARMRGTHSKFGTIVDSIADVVTFVFIYLGAGIGLYLFSPGNEIYAFIIPACAVVNVLIHIYTQGLFRFEYINYVYESYYENLHLPKDIIEKLKNKEYPFKERLYDTLRLIFLSIPSEFIKKLVMPGGYKGYQEWYSADANCRDEVKSFFKNNYKKNNARLLQGFAMLGIGGNYSVFVIAAMLGNLSIAFMVFFIGLNSWFVLMIIIQRVSLSIQLKKANSQV
jgi:phosphatidylglycerophosphate synthase